MNLKTNRQEMVSGGKFVIVFGIIFCFPPTACLIIRNDMVFVSHVFASSNNCARKDCKALVTWPIFRRCAVFGWIFYIKNLLLTASMSQQCTVPQ